MATKAQRDATHQNIHTVVLVLGLLLTIAGWGYAAGTITDRIKNVEQRRAEDRAASEKSDEAIITVLHRVEAQLLDRLDRLETYILQLRSGLLEDKREDR